VEFQNKIVSLSSLSAEFKGDKLNAISGPPGAKPKDSSREIENTVFQAIEDGADLFLIKYREDHIQLPNSLEKHFKDIRSKAKQKNLNWFIWENRISSIRGPLQDPYYKDDWHGSDDIAALVIQRIEALKPYLGLVPEKDNAIEEVTLDENASENSQQVSSALREITASQQDRFTPETIEVLQNEKDELDAINDIAMRTGGVLKEEHQRDLKKTILRVAGFVAGARRSLGRVVENAAGATVANVLTNAGATTVLYAALTKIWELLKPFLSGLIS